MLNVDHEIQRQVDIARGNRSLPGSDHKRTSGGLSRLESPAGPARTLPAQQLRRFNDTRAPSTNASIDTDLSQLGLVHRADGRDQK
jgi:hypothetical protein